MLQCIFMVKIRFLRPALCCPDMNGVHSTFVVDGIQCTGTYKLERVGIRLESCKTMH